MSKVGTWKETRICGQRGKVSRATSKVPFQNSSMPANSFASYYNNVSGGIQHDPPPQFHGGLLADDMGLGKSLSMISLIAANQFVTTTKPYSKVSERVNISCPRVKSTLLVAPSSGKCLNLVGVLKGTQCLLVFFIFHGQLITCLSSFEYQAILNFSTCSRGHSYTS